MPDWLVAMLKKNGQVKSDGEGGPLLAAILATKLTVLGVVSVLALLLEQSSSTKYAYLCHPCVQHISKLKREGTDPQQSFLRTPY